MTCRAAHIAGLLRYKVNLDEEDQAYVEVHYAGLARPSMLFASYRTSPRALPGRCLGAKVFVVALVMHETKP